MAQKKKTRKALDATVDRIIDSYSRYGGINHIKGPNLPARAEIIKTLEDIVTILFPGFFEKSVITTDSVRYHVGAKCTEVQQQLVDQINKCLRYFCKHWRRCKPGEDSCKLMGHKSCLKKAREISRALLEELPALRKILYTDVQAHYVGDPAAKSLDEIILAYPGLAAITVYRIAHVLWNRGVPLLPRIMSEYAHARTGIDIHPGAVIGHHFMIDHGTGVVIGQTTEIGNRVRIYQGVTLGALSVPDHVDLYRWKKRHPTLKDNVTIYSGATILGGKTVIGKGAVIGGNVWITKSVPPNTMVFVEPHATVMTRKRGGKR